jgi:hypothetical protein
VECYILQIHTLHIVQHTIIIHHMHLLYTLLHTCEITLTSDIIIIFILLYNSTFYPEIIWLLIIRSGPDTLTIAFLLSKKWPWRWLEDWLKHVCEDNTRHTFNSVDGYGTYYMDMWTQGVRIQEMKQRRNKFIERNGHQW